jgi:hypothetical protein
METSNAVIEVLDAGVEEELENATACCPGPSAPLKKPVK